MKILVIEEDAFMSAALAKILAANHYAIEYCSRWSDRSRLKVAVLEQVHTALLAGNLDPELQQAAKQE